LLVESLCVGGGLVGTPGLSLLGSFFIISGIERLKELVSGLFLGFLLNGGFLIFLDGLLLGLGVSVHKEIDHDVPLLIAGDITTELEDLAGEEPEAVGDGVAALVVGGDGNINPVKRGVGVGEGDNGDVHVGSFGKGLVVKAGVADNDESGLKELFGVLIGKGTGNPLSAEVVRSSVGSELKDSALGVLAGGNNLKQRVNNQLKPTNALTRARRF